MTRLLAAGLALLTAVAVACGSDSDADPAQDSGTTAAGGSETSVVDAAPSTPAATTAPGETAAADTTSSATTAADDGADEPDDDGAVPDACGLLGDEELDEVLGKDVGEGTPQSVAPERSICIFAADGLILAIEVADHFDGTRQAIEDQGRVTEDVPGVGTAAFSDPAGQIVVLGVRYFVGVTGGGDLAVQEELATRMLAAAGDG